VAELRDGLRATLASFERSEQEFVDLARQFDEDRNAADRERIVARCRELIWKMKAEDPQITDEDRAFFRENDCREHDPDAVAKKRTSD